MARHGGRSKGCAKCRQKRIKVSCCTFGVEFLSSSTQLLTSSLQCDEKLPHCSQCLSSKLICPGALVGNVFLDQPSETAKRRKHRNLNKPNSKTSNEGRCSDPALSTGSSNAVSRAPWKPTLAFPFAFSRFPELEKSASPKKNPGRPERIPPEVSLIPALKEHLLGNFISSLTETPGSPLLKKWLPHVPFLVYQNASPTLQFAAYAASMVLYGSITKNCAVRQEGYRWYGMGLQDQTSQLVTFNKNQSLEDISDAKICGTMLLSFFEMTCGTTSTAWKHHICASARFIELRGAETFKSSLPHELFRAVRLAMVRLDLYHQTWKYLTYSI